jgi:hypothetical protein
MVWDDVIDFSIAKLPPVSSLQRHKQRIPKVKERMPIFLFKLYIHRSKKRWK